MSFYFFFPFEKAKIVRVEIGKITHWAKEGRNKRGWNKSKEGREKGGKKRDLDERDGDLQRGKSAKWAKHEF